ARALFVLERALFGAGDVTAVLPRFEALLPADEAVLGMKRACLTGSDFAFAAFLIDAVVLVVEARIHLGAAGVGLVPGLGVGETGGAGDDAEGKHDNGNARTIRDRGHRVLPSAGRVLSHPTPERCRGGR